MEKSSGRLASLDAFRGAGLSPRIDMEATTTELIALVTPISIVLLGLLIGLIAYALLGTVMEVYDFAT